MENTNLIGQSVYFRVGNRTSYGKVLPPRKFVELNDKGEEEEVIENQILDYRCDKVCVPDLVWRTRDEYMHLRNSKKIKLGGDNGMKRK